MLEIKLVDDKFEILVTVWIILITNIPDRYQNLNSVSNIKKRHFKSPTSLWVKTMVQESLKEIDYGGDEQLNAASQALIGFLICPHR